MVTIIEIGSGAVGGAGAAYLLIKVFGKKWIDSIFEKEQERFRYRINSLFNRITKIHEKEFEVLPEAWKKLQDALGYITDITSPMQSYPDLDKMTEPEIRDLLINEKIKKQDIERIIAEKNKIQIYREIIFPYRLQRAKECVNEFHNYILYNSIFLSSDFFKKFKEMDDCLLEAIEACKIGAEVREHKLISDAYKEVQKKADEITPQIEKMVQERLHFSDAT